MKRASTTPKSKIKYFDPDCKCNNHSSTCTCGGFCLVIKIIKIIDIRFVWFKLYDIYRTVSTTHGEKNVNYVSKAT